MKKVFRVLGIALGVLLIVALGLASYIYFNDIPHYKVEQINFKLKSSPKAIARGKKLTLMLCAGCHKDPKTGKLVGAQMLEAPGEFGIIRSQNITQDKEFGIGNWKDEELVFLLRTGIKPDGQYIPPYMAKLAHMADEDINAIIAFLRSDDPLVAADPTPDKPSEVSFLTKFLCYVAWKPMKYPTEKIAMPDTNNPVELGKYLAYNLECFSCHSADFKTNDYVNPEKSKGFFGGGNPTMNTKKEVIPTSNLTPDPETGIGNWTEEAFVKALKSGIVKGQPALRYPMLPYLQLSDKEAIAIFAYLKTLPPIKNKVERKFN